MRRLVEAVNSRWQCRGLPLDRWQPTGVRPRHVNERFRLSRAVAVPSLPEEQRANLDTFVAVLEARGVEHFVVATTHDEPWRIAATAEDRGRVAPGLVELAAQEPIYLKVRGRGGIRTELGIRFSQADLEAASGIGLYRVVDDPVTGRVIGENAACWLDFWEEDDEGRLVAPVPNRRTEFLTETDRQDVTVLREGPAIGHRTLRSLDRRDPFEVTFPIDVVYLWVDDEDAAWRARRDRRLEEVGRAPVAPRGHHHFRSHDELRYSLRSLCHYAPWVRHVYLLTDDQRPSWLVENHPRLTVVDHREVLPASALPTYNSHAITAAVHHIEGLSERFLLLNDDVLFATDAVPEDFFHANGIVKFFLSASAIPAGPIAPDDPEHMAARKRARELVDAAYGVAPRQNFKHTPVPLLRSMLTVLEQKYPEDYERTIHTPFRSVDDVVVSWLHHYMGHAEGRSVPGEVSYGYFNLGSRAAFRRLRALLQGQEKQCICLNDAPGAVSDEERETLLRLFLDAFLPFPSEFEQGAPEPVDREVAARRFHQLVAAL